MAILNIPAPFRPYTGGDNEIELQAKNVEEAITELIEEYPDLKIHLMNEDGTLRNFVNLFLNGEDIRYLQGVETQLLDQDKLQIIPSIAGG
jgi:molybdopterin synthase sulfur carrier subunit